MLAKEKLTEDNLREVDKRAASRRKKLEDEENSCEERKEEAEGEEKSHDNQSESRQQDIVRHLHFAGNQVMQASG